MEQKGENVTVMVSLTQGDTEHYSTLHFCPHELQMASSTIYIGGT
jgi:hypothetical protein